MFVYLVGIFFAGVTLLLGRFLMGFMRRAPHGLDAKSAQTTPFPHANEKRVAVRRTGLPLKVLISDAKATKKPFAGLVMNRSIGGLCILVPEKVPEKTILSVRAENAPKDAPWIQVEVRRCETRGVRFEFGCQFVKQPSDSNLDLFG
jgi:hypothetical protein